MLKIRNKGDRAAELYVTGTIVDDDVGGCLESWGDPGTGYEWPKAIRQQLDELKGRDLTVYINSDGGSVPAGVAIANMVARHDGRTTAVVDGWCCSIATQIFFAADERRMPANAYLMIHKPSVTVTGDADQLLETAAALDTIQEGLETTYRAAAREGTTAQQIHDMTNAETWLTGAEAAELFHIELTEPVKAVACAGDAARFDHIPDGVRAVDDDQAGAEVDEALANARGVLMQS